MVREQKYRNCLHPGIGMGKKQASEKGENVVLLHRHRAGF